jgi:hypothetical protein
MIECISFLTAMTQVDLFSSSAGLPASREVAQHNHLIFAPFALGSLESIIFISMLERISRTDTVFQEWKIPVTDILPHRNGHYFELLKKARENLVGYVVDIAPVRANGKRSSSLAPSSTNVIMMKLKGISSASSMTTCGIPAEAAWKFYQGRPICTKNF